MSNYEEQRLADKNIEGTYSPICNECIHNNGDSTCKAFPKGILDGILDGRLDHKGFIDGDNGIRFTPE